MNIPNQYLSPKRRFEYQRKKPKRTRRRSSVRGKDVDLALLINRSRMDYEKYRLCTINHANSCSAQ